ncbi:hypothetical protein [Streptomyces sp. NPDC085665]|uniref:hypothetical protein n=1 Tax=Streptomyces sp. NPDC085665 TaxID=3365735 RepID=UPI0037D990D0
MVGILAAHVASGAELPERERLRLRLEHHRFLVLLILLVWLVPAAGVGACLFLVLNGDFADGQAVADAAGVGHPRRSHGALRDGPPHADPTLP